MDSMFIHTIQSDGSSSDHGVPAWGCCASTCASESAGSEISLSDPVGAARGVEVVGVAGFSLVLSRDITIATAPPAIATPAIAGTTHGERLR